MIDTLKIGLKDYSTTIRNIGTVTVLEAQKLVVTSYSPDVSFLFSIVSYSSL